MRQVRANIYKFQNRKSPYRVRWKPRISDKYTTRWFSSRAKAEAFKKEIEIFENGYSDLSENTDLQEIRESQLILKQTDNECASGKSIQFAVNWFIKNYQGDEDVHPIKHYYREYEKIRTSAKGKQKLSKYQLNSDKQLVGFNGSKSFVNTFGNLKPTDITREQIQDYLDSNSSHFHRGKAVTCFINWMLGESKYFNANPCLRINPMKGVDIEPANKNVRREIATNQEVCDLLRIAHSKEYNFSAARWAFMFFTGMRPSECERFWNPKNKLGWNQISLESNDPYIYLPLGLIRKEGLPTRKIPIRPGFRKMLKDFKKEGEKKYPLSTVKNWKRVYSSVRKRVWGKRLTISSMKDEAKDIARHTFISNLHLYAGTIAQVTTESGTKESTLLNHYINPSLSEKDTKYFFESIDTTPFNENVSIKTQNNASPLERIMQIHGKDIIDHPNFIKAWTGSAEIDGFKELTPDERKDLLQKWRKKHLKSYTRSLPIGMIKYRDPETGETFESQGIPTEDQE
jgi:integrase